MNESEATIIGVCWVGRHQTKRDYIILRFAENLAGGATFMYGPVIHVPAREMRANGLDTVLSHVRHPLASDPKALAPWQKLEDREAFKIKRECPLVSVVLFHRDRLTVKLVPLHAGHGWRFNARPEEFRFIPLPTTNNKFMSLLDEVLEEAS